jgi:hypothetical protein
MVCGKRFIVSCRGGCCIGSHHAQPARLFHDSPCWRTDRGCPGRHSRVIVLNGADVFPVLAIALAPFTISAALLVPSKNPVWSGLGRINLIAIPTNSDEGGDLKRIRELEFQRTCRGLDEQGQKELDELTSKYPNQNADCELATAIRDKLM